MHRSVERVVEARSSRGQQKVWKTEIGSVDDNCVMRVKEIDSLYKADAPVATEPVATEPVSVKNKSTKRRKHGEENETFWRKKVHRTRTAAEEEEETITLNLRKADTVIDVSIKSLAKKKRVARRMLAVKEAAVSSERHSTSSLPGTSSFATQTKQAKTSNTRPISVGGDRLFYRSLENNKGNDVGRSQERNTYVLGGSRRSKATGEGVKKCLHGKLHLVPAAQVGEETSTLAVAPPMTAASSTALSNRFLDNPRQVNEASPYETMRLSIPSTIA